MNQNGQRTLIPDAMRGAANRRVIMAFDLAWAGKTGWAVLALPTMPITGVLKALAVTCAADEMGQARRAYALCHALAHLIQRASPSEIVYETPIGWIVQAAGRRGKRARRPITPVSLMGSLSPITCLRIAVIMTVEGSQSAPAPTLRPLDTMTVRRRMAVQDAASIKRAQVAELLASGYDDTNKAMVGAALPLLFEQHQMQVNAPATDHEADALLMALYAYENPMAPALKAARRRTRRTAAAGHVAS
jgi:hypothetical protein